MDLATNAIESIQAGVEDYLTATRPRLLSAVRNIHAGILLLYKEALRRRSPPGSNDALVMAKINPITSATGIVTFVGSGKKTADARVIRERFEGLGISTDWDRFGKIAESRNDVEHNYPNLSQDSLRELVASAFWIIRDFITTELAADPVQLLGSPTWRAMLEVADVYHAEREACDEALARVAWESETLAAGLRELPCGNCGSTLHRPQDPSADLDDMVLACAVCGATQEADAFAPGAIAAALDWDSYVAATDGADEPYVDCPECGSAAYVLSEERCARCGASVEGNCVRCGNRIPASELDSSPLCGYCAHVMSKDD
jgi:DNA-directed RNA polymerase subunit M/transcription elongation factor TFIIS